MIKRKELKYRKVLIHIKNSLKIYNTLKSPTHLHLKMISTIKLDSKVLIKYFKIKDKKLISSNKIVAIQAKNIFSIKIIKALINKI